MGRAPAGTVAEGHRGLRGRSPACTHCRESSPSWISPPGETGAPSGVNRCPAANWNHPVDNDLGVSFYVHPSPSTQAPPGI